VKNTLIFTQSRLGQSFYLYLNRPAVSFYQLEHDYFYPGRTMAGLGRYVLFRILGPSKHVRLELDATATFIQDRSKALPPAAAVGATRSPLPLVGRGSARVYSPPLRPQMIGGQPYVLLDMGTSGRIPPSPRSTLGGLYGRSIPLDPRYLTAYVRDISVIGEAEFRRRRPPQEIGRFPDDLADNRLEYSGIYEDGWVGEDSYVVLESRPGADLVVRAQVLPIDGQELQVFVDGRRVASKRVKSGSLAMRVRVPSWGGPRRVELRWRAVGALAPPDTRRAVARLEHVGFAASTAASSQATSSSRLRRRPTASRPRWHPK
jgi:hypothetical protein